jgi:hypothetical protein
MTAPAAPGAAAHAGAAPGEVGVTEGEDCHHEIAPLVAAFWHACAGGQRRAAEYLLSQGADLDWEPNYARGRALDAAGGESTRQQNVITWLQDLGARPAPPESSEG